MNKKRLERLEKSSQKKTVKIEVVYLDARKSVEENS